MTDERIITVTDAFRAGHCVSGIRDFIENTLEMDVRDVFKNGVPASVLEEKGGEIGRRIIELKNRSEHGGK